MKPRKKYRPDPSRKLENRFLRATEAANLEKWRKVHFQMMDGYQAGQHCDHMLKALADVIATAAKSMEGWDDPDDIGDVLVDAMDAIRIMAERGFAWNPEAMPLLKEATGYALQITNGMPVMEIARATHWTRQVQRQVLEESCT